MPLRIVFLLPVFALMALVTPASPVFAQSIDYGDDSSAWAKDGECDDPRFAGDSMAETLLDEDIGHDATDCKYGVEIGSLRYIGNSSSGNVIEYGDDSSEWAFDDECDDPRFEGEGMADVLLDEDIMSDATDCKNGMLNGRIRYVGSSSSQSFVGGINYGDNSSEWANDGECDDPRFEGADMAEILLDEDKFHDANDCREGVESGSLRYIGGANVSSDGINYGDDSSVWSNDGECDDPRFEGSSMADTLLDSDKYHDATDCREGVQNGSLQYIGD